MPPRPAPPWQTSSRPARAPRLVARPARPGERGRTGSGDKLRLRRQLRLKGITMAVEIGDEAPDFELKDQHGTPVTLSGLRGKKHVVLVFYPLAFSGVCSGEMCEMRDSFPEAERDDVELLTVSVDSVHTHRAWAEVEGFEFGLLSDFWPHGEVAKSYGVFDDEKGIATRGTFIIDKDGVVRWKVVNAIPQARDIADYQRALAELD